MGTYYLQVAEDSESEPMEMPTETDGSLLLSTLAAQFPGVSGLKFRNVETGGMRGVRLADGRFHPPEKDGWGDHVYYCVLRKGDKKRKWEECEDGDVREGGNKRFESRPNQRCSDLIVLDLPWKTTEDEMREYFQAFGDIILAQVKKDIKTGQSKGYGFIRFTNYDSQVKVLGQRHFIQGRWCDVKIPNSKESQHSNVSPKVYVGRLTEDITAEDLREYFSNFGEVTHVFTPKPYRAFAFVTFMHADVAQGLCGEDHIIKGVSVFISNAAPKTDSRDRDRVERDRDRDRIRDRDRDSLSRQQDSYQNKDYRDGGSLGQGQSQNQGQGGQGQCQVQMQGQGQGQGSSDPIWNTSGVGGGRGIGVGGLDLSQIASNGSGNGPGLNSAALGNFNLSSQLNHAIVSAVLNQAVLGFVGSMQGQGQGQGQVQHSHPHIHAQSGSSPQQQQQQQSPQVQGQGPGQGPTQGPAQGQNHGSQSYGKQPSSVTGFGFPTAQGAQALHSTPRSSVSGTPLILLRVTGASNSPAALTVPLIIIIIPLIHSSVL